MSLIGAFYDTGAISNDGAVIEILLFSSPGEIDLGTVPENHFIEEIKCHVITPAAAGTTFKIIDAEDNIIMPDTYITVDVADATSVGSVNKKTTSQITLRGIFEGPSATNTNFIFIKKIVRLP